MRAQRVRETRGRPRGTPVAVIVAVIVIVILVVIVVAVVVVMTRGARTRLVHAPEGARKTALQHLGNGKPRAVATRSRRAGGPLPQQGRRGRVGEDDRF